MAKKKNKVKKEKSFYNDVIMGGVKKSPKDKCGILASDKYKDDSELYLIDDKELFNYNNRTSVGIGADGILYQLTVDKDKKKGLYNGDKDLMKEGGLITDEEHKYIENIENDFINGLKKVSNKMVGKEDNFKIDISKSALELSDIMVEVMEGEKEDTIELSKLITDTRFNDTEREYVFSTARELSDRIHLLSNRESNVAEIMTEISNYLEFAGYTFEGIGKVTNDVELLLTKKEYDGNIFGVSVSSDELVIMNNTTGEFIYSISSIEDTDTTNIEEVLDSVENSLLYAGQSNDIDNILNDVRTELRETYPNSKRLSVGYSDGEMSVICEKSQEIIHSIYIPSILCKGVSFTKALNCFKEECKSLGFESNEMEKTLKEIHKKGEVKEYEVIVKNEADLEFVDSITEEVLLDTEDYNKISLFNKTEEVK